MRKKVIPPQILALPRREGRLTVDADACNEKIGCVLFQYQEEGPAKPIRYCSRALITTERDYNTTQHKCFILVSAVLLLHRYLEGTKFIVRTDHHGLKWILNLTDAPKKLARWTLGLS